MSADFGACPSLSDQAREVVCRIFGEGESPLKDRSSYELIGPMVKRHIAAPDRNSVMREIQGWFESDGNRHWLRPEMQERVAVVILDGIGPADQSETAVWAIGSINAELAARKMRANWSASAIDGFVHATLRTLKTACDRNKVLEASGSFGLDLDSANAGIPGDAFPREWSVGTFQNLLKHGRRFVVSGLHPAVGNLIALTVALRPDLLGRLVERLDHPVVQGRGGSAARSRLPALRTIARPWIGSVRLHALRRLPWRSCTRSKPSTPWTTTCGPQGARTWTDTVGLPNCARPATTSTRRLRASWADWADSLSHLTPGACARWIGELLGAAPRSLHSHGDGKALRVQQLEAACNEALVRLVHQSWSSDLSEILITGLRTDPSETWTRHLGDLAWALRESAPERAAEIARAALRSHEARVKQVLGAQLTNSGLALLGAPGVDRAVWAPASPSRIEHWILGSGSWTGANNCL